MNTTLPATAVGTLVSSKLIRPACGSKNQASALPLPSGNSRVPVAAALAVAAGAAHSRG